MPLSHTHTRNNNRQRGQGEAGWKHLEAMHLLQHRPWCRSHGRGLISKPITLHTLNAHSFLHVTHTSMKLKVKLLSHVQLFVTLWTIAHQTPPFMGFSRQEHWSGLPFPSPGNLPDPGIELRSPALQADFLPSEELSVCHSYLNKVA